ncbi:MAG: alpha/beta fold hydrolase [Alphaproteobacteria bacterium]|nr:alpha/beta fold hydrolase [Alphaproteobacteria bacterium]
MWTDLFSREPKPFHEGVLPERDGHSIYYYQYGNPNGIPVLSFHGGPGGSSRPKYAKLFDLKKYHFIQFDQRGCGRSFCVDATDHNETSFLIADALHLLKHLNINEPIIVHGVSWGSTLALLFAEAQPKMVQKIVVSSVFLARPSDVAWVNSESERFYPDIWDTMREKLHTNDVLRESFRLMFSRKIEENLKAISYWGSYEHMLGELNPSFTEIAEIAPQDLVSARVAFHYAENDYFLSSNQILHNAGKIKDIPTLIVHNRMDFCCTVKQAWELHKALPQSQIHILGGYGHSSPQLLKEVKKQLKTFL